MDRGMAGGRQAVQRWGGGGGVIGGAPPHRARIGVYLASKRAWGYPNNSGKL